MPNLNSGEPWSEMDLHDLRYGVQIGTSLRSSPTSCAAMSQRSKPRRPSCGASGAG